MKEEESGRWLKWGPEGHRWETRVGGGQDGQHVVLVTNCLVFYCFPSKLDCSFNESTELISAMCWHKMQGGNHGFFHSCLASMSLANLFQLQPCTGMPSLINNMHYWRDTPYSYSSLTLTTWEKKHQIELQFYDFVVKDQWTALDCTPNPAGFILKTSTDLL